MTAGTHADIPGLVRRTYGLDLKDFIDRMWQYRGGGLNP